MGVTEGGRRVFLVRRLLVFRKREKSVITDYEVVTATHVGDLQDRVRERIRTGWQPIGGIAVVHEKKAATRKPHMVFAQSVVSSLPGGEKGRGKGKK